MKRFIQIGYLLGLCGSNAFAATISLQPAASTLPLGSPLTLDVNISGISDLYAFQFDIGFNPATLSATTVTEGSLFSNVGVFFSPGMLDNGAGTITFIGDSLSGPGPGISADGTLAQITFNAVGPGSSSVVLLNVILLDSNLGDITVGMALGTVLVGGVPEPGSWGLTAVGLGALWLAARRRALRRSVTRGRRAVCG